VFALVHQPQQAAVAPLAALVAGLVFIGGPRLVVG
jgi:hypothetical protein